MRHIHQLSSVPNRVLGSQIVVLAAMIFGATTIVGCNNYLKQWQLPTCIVQPYRAHHQLPFTLAQMG